MIAGQITKIVLLCCILSSVQSSVPCNGDTCQKRPGNSINQQVNYTIENTTKWEFKLGILSLAVHYFDVITKYLFGETRHARNLNKIFQQQVEIQPPLLVELENGYQLNGTDKETLVLLKRMARSMLDQLNVKPDEMTNYTEIFLSGVLLRQVWSEILMVQSELSYDLAAFIDNMTNNKIFFLQDPSDTVSSPLRESKSNGWKRDRQINSTHVSKRLPRSTKPEDITAGINQIHAIRNRLFLLRDKLMKYPDMHLMANKLVDELGALHANMSNTKALYDQAASNPSNASEKEARELLIKLKLLSRKIELALQLQQMRDRLFQLSPSENNAKILQELGSGLTGQMTVEDLVKRLPRSTALKPEDITTGINQIQALRNRLLSLRDKLMKYPDMHLMANKLLDELGALHANMSNTKALYDQAASNPSSAPEKEARELLVKLKLLSRKIELEIQLQQMRCKLFQLFSSENNAKNFHGRESGLTGQETNTDDVLKRLPRSTATQLNPKPKASTTVANILYIRNRLLLLRNSLLKYPDMQSTANQLMDRLGALYASMSNIKTDPLYAAEGDRHLEKAQELLMKLKLLSLGTKLERQIQRMIIKLHRYSRTLVENDSDILQALESVRTDQETKREPRFTPTRFNTKFVNSGKIMTDEQELALSLFYFQLSFRSHKLMLSMANQLAEDVTALNNKTQPRSSVQESELDKEKEEQMGKVSSRCMEILRLLEWWSHNVSPVNVTAKNIFQHPLYKWKKHKGQLQMYNGTELNRLANLTTTVERLFGNIVASNVDVRNKRETSQSSLRKSSLSKRHIDINGFPKLPEYIYDYWIHDDLDDEPPLRVERSAGINPDRIGDTESHGGDWNYVRIAHGNLTSYRTVENHRAPESRNARNDDPLSI